MFTYSFIYANISLASLVLLTSGWYNLANLKYDFFISSLVEDLVTSNISIDFFMN